MRCPNTFVAILAAITVIWTPLTAQDAPCTVRTLVGNPNPASGDGGPATEASFLGLSGIAVGPDGTIYVGDGTNSKIRRIDTSGIVRTLAGTGVLGFSGDGGLAVEARLWRPTFVATGPDGSVYFVDRENVRVRRVRPNGVIETVAGTGEHEWAYEEGMATETGLWDPRGLAVDAAGNLYIADKPHDRIRKVTPAGWMTTFAGGGLPSGSGDGGPATEARLKKPVDVAVGPDGSLYIADSGYRRIRRVRPDGIIEHVAGGGLGSTGDPTVDGDGGPAVDARLTEEIAIAVDQTGVLWLKDGDRVRLIANGIIEGVPGVTDVIGVAADAEGRLLFTTSGDEVRRRSAEGEITVIGGRAPVGLFEGGPAERFQFRPSLLAYGADGAIYLLLEHASGGQIVRLVRN